MKFITILRKILEREAGNAQSRDPERRQLSRMMCKTVSEAQKLHGLHVPQSTHSEAPSELPLTVSRGFSVSVL
jgi:hypothetical protein